MKPSHVVTLLLFGLSGCAPHFPTPMTAAQLATYNTGAAMAHYLGQPDASPSVCTPKTQGPHLSNLSQTDADAFTDGLFTGQVPTKIWQRCADVLLADSPPNQAAHLLDSMGRTYRKLLRAKELEDDKLLQRRLRALHKVFIERPSGLDGSPQLMAKLFAGLDTAVMKKRLGALATVFGEELLDIVEIEKGTYDDKPITPETIADLYEKQDEKVLFRFATRLREPTLRDESKKRVIELRIAASAYPEVRKNAQSVEAIMLKLGRLPVSTAKYPPTKASFTAGKVPTHGVLVKQSIGDQTAVLLGYEEGKTGVSVLPELQLRGALQIELRGVSRPVTLCGPTRDLDVSPCVPAEEVTLANPIAYLDTDGAFHFKEHIAEKDAFDLAQGGADFQLPLSIANHPLVNLIWGLHYSPPTDLDFAGAVPGERGPDVKVKVEARDGRRILYTARTPAGELHAVAEAADARAFHILSRGAQGYTGRAGHPGHDGARGRDGASSSCPSSSAGDGGPGGSGGNGGPAGDGGPGGNGGNIDVALLCGQHCDAVQPLIATNIHSEAGLPGLPGPGGRAGRGGHGGSGGSSSSCGSGDSAYTIPRGADGASGTDGIAGPDGLPGLPGRAGRTAIHVAR